MARLDVHWAGDPRGEVALALLDLGLEEAGAGHYFAEGEGRILVRVVGAVRDIERHANSELSADSLTVRFVDPGAGTQRGFGLHPLRPF